MKRPNEDEYVSHVAYTRALEDYCDALLNQEWMGLTDAEVERESSPIDARLKLAFRSGMYVAGKLLKEKNT